MVRQLRLPLLTLLVIMLALGSPLQPSLAAENDRDVAIALAAAAPALAPILAENEGYRADAFTSSSALQIWRVQFWASDGAELAWADVWVAKGKVYAWEINSDLADQRVKRAETAITAFAKANVETRPLLEALDEFETYSSYIKEFDVWVMVFHSGSDAVEVTVKFADSAGLRNPQLLRIRFPWLASYPEWFNAQQAVAISIASTASDVATRIASNPGWVATAKPITTEQWVVEFRAGDQVFATVTVDVRNRVIINIS